MQHDAPGAAADVRADNRIQLRWHGAHRFEGGRPGGPTAMIDADAASAPSPVDTLLLALASCTAVDVVDILKKRRTEPAGLEVDVVAERSTGTPRRLTKVHLGYRIVGGGVERGHAERAIALAVTRYCSVRDSLDPALPVTWSLSLDEG